MELGGMAKATAIDPHKAAWRGIATRPVQSGAARCCDYIRARLGDGVRGRILTGINMIDETEHAPKHPPEFFLPETDARIAQPGELTKLRLRLHSNGYHPVPVVGAHIKTNSAGKRPTMSGWETKCATATPDEVAGWSRDRVDDTNTGVLCGEIVGVDIDVLDVALSAKLAARAIELFGPTPLRRIGRAPKTLLVYRMAVPTAKMQTPTLIFGNDPATKIAEDIVKVEILAQGQQFVAFGIHPDTQDYYHWSDQSLADQSLADVPLVTLELLLQFVTEAEQVLRAAGGRTKAEILEATAGPQQQKQQQQKQPPPPPPPQDEDDGFGPKMGEETTNKEKPVDFFKMVNALALSALTKWVPALFGSAATFHATGTTAGGYRIKSTDLGRTNDEDLSISPKGIKDFGVYDEGDPRQGKRTAIDVVVEFTPRTSQFDTGMKPADAALWLCKQMSIPPGALGWNGATQQEGPVHTGPYIVSSAGFLAGFIPPDYLIDGILQRRFCYSFTAPTGSGKTAIALLLSVHVALGRRIGEAFVEKGRVLYLAGENPDDIRMRWLAAAEKLDFDPATIDVHFLPGVYKISAIYDSIHAEVMKIGPVALVVVDTSAAYFEGDDENGNVQMGDHARRLRSLVKLPGEPCVLIACHPVKNAVADNMVPKGGGSFLNEVDGNLTGAKNDSVVTLHWQGKYRGPDFAPIPFQLHTVTTELLKDSKGRLIPSVVAVPLSDEERGQADANSRRDEDHLLMTIHNGGRKSMTDLAAVLNWTTNSGKPNKSRVQRASERLKKAKMIKVERGTLVLTTAGTKEAKRVMEL
jgi:hypothetical protein